MILSRARISLAALFACLALNTSSLPSIAFELVSNWTWMDSFLYTRYYQLSELCLSLCHSVYIRRLSGLFLKGPDNQNYTLLQPAINFISLYNFSLSILYINYILILL